ncbi:MAG TPA: phospho-sugar mutase, partial [Bacteroidales bacterium]|nr:phospho-sugar mutase [Bacteroidales bacterium]
ISSACLFAETTAWARDHGKTVWDLLLDIYAEYGLYKERLINVVRKGPEGAAQIKKMMEDYRNAPQTEIAGSKVVKIFDWQELTSTDMTTGKKSPLEPQKSNVLQFFLADGSKISVRPSGTEPKIKFYFSVNIKIESVSEFDEKEKMLETRIDNIIRDMNLA